MMARAEKSNSRKVVVAAVLYGLLVIPTGWAMAEDGTAPVAETKVAMAYDQQFAQILALLTEQDKKNSREFRQLKRDLAALGQQMETPGISEILGGIGYIFGLFGVAAYVMSRKKNLAGGR
ncbi:MAG: hypothetical protein ACK5PS_12335 [Desulfopila sp.]